MEAPFSDLRFWLWVSVYLGMIVGIILLPRYMSWVLRRAERKGLREDQAQGDTDE